MSTDSSSGLTPTTPLTLTTQTSSTTPPPRTSSSAAAPVVRCHRMDVDDGEEDRERSPPPRRGSSLVPAARTGQTASSPYEGFSVISRRRASSGSRPVDKRVADVPDTVSSRRSRALPPPFLPDGEAYQRPLADLPPEGGRDRGRAPLRATSRPPLPGSVVAGGSGSLSAPHDGSGSTSAP